MFAERISGFPRLSLLNLTPDQLATCTSRQLSLLTGYAISKTGPHAELRTPCRTEEGETNEHPLAWPLRTYLVGELAVAPQRVFNKTDIKCFLEM